MRKTLRNFTGRHSSTTFAKGKKDLPPYAVRQSTKDGIGGSRFVGSSMWFR
jgi:hypothetical protein